MPDPTEDRSGDNGEQYEETLGDDADGDRGDGPLAHRDQPFSGDNCANKGGLNQNIYGTSLGLP